MAASDVFAREVESAGAVATWTQIGSWALSLRSHSQVAVRLTWRAIVSGGICRVAVEVFGSGYSQGGREVTKEATVIKVEAVRFTLRLTAGCSQLTPHWYFLTWQSPLSGHCL